METWASYALAASLTMILAPNNQQLINLLGLHFISKIFIFWPSYLLNINSARLAGHTLSLASLVGIAWKLALGAS